MRYWNMKHEKSVCVRFTENHCKKIIEVKLKLSRSRGGQIEQWLCIILRKP